MYEFSNLHEVEIFKSFLIWRTHKFKSIHFRIKLNTNCALKLPLSALQSLPPSPSPKACVWVISRQLFELSMLFINSVTVQGCLFLEDPAHQLCLSPEYPARLNSSTLPTESLSWQFPSLRKMVASPMDNIYHIDWSHKPIRVVIGLLAVQLQ